MPIKDHIDNTLRINPEPTPLFKMILAAIAITTPLIYGYYFNYLFVSMFGSLMGLVFYLNDPFGPYLKRFKHLIVTFFFLKIALTMGAYSVGHDYIIIPVLFALSFLVGKSKTYGTDLERLLLFVTLQFLTASSETIIKLELKHLLFFTGLAFVNYLFWASILYKLTGHKVSAMVSKRETVKKIMTDNKSSYFPFVCALFSCTGYITARALEFSHANWIVATALIVMLPDSYQSIYKSIQRVVGTTAGVILATIVLIYVKDPRFLIAFVFVLSFLMPHGLSKNYWIGNVYIAAMIIFFLEIAAPHSIADHHLAYWRIVDIAIGCFIGILAALVINPEILKKVTRKLGH